MDGRRGLGGLERKRGLAELARPEQDQGRSLVEGDGALGEEPPGTIRAILE